METTPHIVIYTTADGKVQIDVKLDGNTVWLTQTQMSELFQTDRSVIVRHIKNIYKDGELLEQATCAKNAQVRQEGNRKVSRMIPFYSFTDGNKRIAATLFLWFMNNNGILYNNDGSKRIADNTLVALTLMIAESKTEEKDVIVKVVVNLINQNN
ncbi:MAG TPA: hypothetical protein VIQ97_05710 [Prevotella sp.]